MTTATSPRDRLAELLRDNGVDEHFDIAEFIADWSDEQVVRAIESFTAAATEKAAFRDRLRSNPTLSRAVCPADGWKTGPERYDIARRGVRIVEAYAAKHDLTVDALAAQLIAGGGTIADTITMHGVDPRADDYAGGTTGFYAFRCRLNDAVDELTADARRAERDRIEAAKDAVWADRGLVRCDRCGGAGGSTSWPGFYCFDCGGEGAVTPKVGRS